MPSSCPRGRVMSRGRCVKKCRPDQVRSRKTNRCRLRRIGSRRRAKPSRSNRGRSTKQGRGRAKKSRPTTKRGRSREIVKCINSIEGRKVVKISAKGNIRPSAAQAYRDGARLGSVVYYDGKHKRLRLDKNGRAYWGV